MRGIVTTILLILVVAPVTAMQIEADPRIITSFMDKSLSPELDILRVSTDISTDNNLIFRVKTRGERIDGAGNEYLVLHIAHEHAYVLLIPLNKKNDRLLVFTGDLHPESHLDSVTFKKSAKFNRRAAFNANHIDRGAEFTVPLDWINFGADFSYDAYTIQAEMQQDALQIKKIYDQARKGRNNETRISAITLLNKICSPKK